MAALVSLLFLTLVYSCIALPEQGTWTVDLDSGGQYASFSKSVYSQSKVALKIHCHSESQTDVKVQVSWLLRLANCAEEYLGIDEGTDEERAARLMTYFNTPGIVYGPYINKEVRYQQSKVQVFPCNQNTIILEDESEKGYNSQGATPSEQNNSTEVDLAGSPKSLPAIDVKTTTKKPAPKPTTTKATTKAPVKAPTGVKSTANKGTTANKSTPNKPGKTAGDKPFEGKPNLSTAKPKPKQKRSISKRDIKSKALLNNGTMAPGNPIDHSIITKAWQDGVYLLIIHISPNTNNEKFNATAEIWMKGTSGYLSAAEWPLLPFYGIMCIVYVIYGIVWLVLTFCNWRDLLRIQFWIGGVVLLGMLEKAVFFGEYESINTTGKSVRGAVVFAELVSCLKRTLARMLVVIVSLGFGIVKPRLGPMLHRVLGVGALYFILGSIEGCLRVLRPKTDPSRQALLASIPLAVLDAGICWWVFTSLVQTTRTLRLRRNLVKLSLYKHFTNTLIFAVLASVAFMIWSIKQHKLVTCLTDWKELWVDDAYWHLLFSVILLVIMILWRPTNNNQRYAFSPLLDAADDEEEEPMINDAFEGMKMRGVKGQSNGSPKVKDAKQKAEDDLKWIEDNIPSSVADTALPSLLDSDEEIMTTKFEMSKME